MALLDAWKAPEPSQYFDQKLAVLLREEQEKEPAGWLERLRERLLWNTGRQFRPALVGAMALFDYAGRRILHWCFDLEPSGRSAGVGDSE